MEISERVIVGTQVGQGSFETRIDSTLARGFEYEVRAFATYNSKTVYGNTITFESKGSKGSPWAIEISEIKLNRSNLYGWSDRDYGYVIFQNGHAYKFDPDTKEFSPIPRLHESGNSGTKYTSIGFGNIQYVFSNLDQNLYRLNGNVWSIQSNTPFRYGGLSYYHGYSSLDQIYLLSSGRSYSYNPKTDFWQSRAAMPADGSSISGTDLNGYAYLMDTRKNIQKYDPKTDNWEFISVFPGNFPEGSVSFNRYYGNTPGFSHGNKIYFGFSNDEDSPDIEESIWGYDLSKSLWKEIAPFPVDLKNGKVFHFTLKGKLYIAHGTSDKYNIYSLDLSKL